MEEKQEQAVEKRDGMTEAVENAVRDEVEDNAIAANVALIRDAEKKKKVVRKKILFYALFIVVSAAVITGMVLFEDRSGDMASGKEALRRLGEHPVYTAIAVLLYFVILLADTAVFFGLTRKISNRASLGASAKVSLLGRYFDKVTPWAIGGEPFQILFLKKRGLSGADACAVTMSRHIIRFFSTAIVVLAIIAFSGVSANVYVVVAAIVSILGGLIIPTFMLVCAFRPTIGKKISDGVIGFLAKIKIIKYKEKAKKKVADLVTEFLSGVKYLSVNKSMIVLIAVAAIVEIFANSAAPYFVMKALGVQNVPFWDTFVKCLFVNHSASFVPTPGGSGIAELSFYAIFSSHVGEGMLFWTVLFWRIVVFYIPVFLGFIVSTVSSVAEIVRLKRA